MAADHHKEFKFIYPKPLIEASGRSTKSLLQHHRPQPSPSKREIMMKELGLDQDDLQHDSGSDSSVTFSDDDNTLMKMIEGPTKTEHDALQKDRDNLLILNKELGEELRHCKSLLQREELKYQRHVKILKKAQKDVMKDKDLLIVNLEDIIFEYEMRIRDLEDALKGNPIKPTIEKAPEVSSIQKLIDSIQSFQSERYTSSNRILHLEQSLDEKALEIQMLQQNPILTQNVIEQNGVTAGYEEMIDKLKSELRNIKSLLDEREKELIYERENRDLISDKLDRVEIRIKDIESERRRSEKKLRIEIEDLKTELEKKTTELYELESIPPRVVTKTVECVVEVESSQQKSEITFANERLSEFENSLKDQDKILTKKSEEIARLKDKLRIAQDELLTVRSEMDDKISYHLDEEAKLRFELRQKETDLNKERKCVEKEKKNLKKEKSKTSEMEQELQELKASSKRNKDEALAEYTLLMKKMKQMEEGYKEELKDAEKSFAMQKQDFESVIDRLEKKIRRTEENLVKARDFNRNLSEKLEAGSNKIGSLLAEMDNKENAIAAKASRITELENSFLEEKRKLEDEKQNLLIANDQNKALQNQIKDLSGASDIATVELSNLRSDNATLRMNISRVETQKKNCEVELAVVQLKQKEMLLHQEMFEKKLVAQRNEHEKEMTHLSERHASELESERVSVNCEIRNYSSKLHKMRYALRHIMSSLNSVTKENQHLKKECSKFPELIEETLRQAERKIIDSIADINENNKEIIRRYRKEMMLRKKYHNELVELKGNIRVFARVRPTISEDGSGSQAKITISYDQNDDGVIYVHNAQRGRSTLFELDKVFQRDSSQSEVYSEVKSLVTSCIDGYHVCIFAYGQTGSGKTYTMEGPTSNPGINQRALSDLFTEIELKTGDWSFEVSVSLIEIYNESLKDLLDAKKANEKLEIKMNADGSLYVPGLSQKSVHNLEDVNSLFTLGRKNRATACTNMNEHSSRSHAVLMIHINGINTSTNVRTYGKLNLIDLAGSERVSKSGASGDRLKEAQNINKSLSALGDVIQALGAKQSHVPFRNSKLTYLLQDSLSKDSKTLMVVQVAPVEKNVSETICSLSFAQRVRKVELGQANKKVENDSTPKKSSSNTPGGRTGQQARKK